METRQHRHGSEVDMPHRLTAGALSLITALSVGSLVRDANAVCGGFGATICARAVVTTRKVVRTVVSGRGAGPAQAHVRALGAPSGRSQVMASNPFVAGISTPPPCSPWRPPCGLPRQAAVPAAVPAAGVPAAAPVVVVTTVELAAQAMEQAALPVPIPKRSPEQSLPDGRSTTFVKLPTWFYVPAEQWKPVSVTAAAGGVSSTVTATPSSLSFDPGNGDGPVTCTGPGRAWVEGRDGNLDAAPGGCGYTYLKTSFGHPGGMVTARYTITWKVTWAGSDGASGALPNKTTSSTATFAVAEAQAVVQ